MPSTKFRPNPTYRSGADNNNFEDFQAGRHGGHLGYRNKMILAILNRNDASMPPSGFGLVRLTNQTEQIWFKIFRMTAVAARLDIGTERF